MRHSERGATMVEYAVLAALIVSVVIGTVSLLGERIDSSFVRLQLEFARSSDPGGAEGEGGD